MNFERIEKLEEWRIKHVGNRLTIDSEYNKKLAELKEKFNKLKQLIPMEWKQQYFEKEIILIREVLRKFIENFMCEFLMIDCEEWDEYIEEKNFYERLLDKLGGDSETKRHWGMGKNGGEWKGGDSLEKVWLSCVNYDISKRKCNNFQCKCEEYKEGSSELDNFKIKYPLTAAYNTPETIEKLIEILKKYLGAEKQ